MQKLRWNIIQHHQTFHSINDLMITDYRKRCLCEKKYVKKHIFAVETVENVLALAKY